MLIFPVFYPISFISELGFALCTLMRRLCVVKQHVSIQVTLILEFLKAQYALETLLVVVITGPRCTVAYVRETYSEKLAK